MPKLSCLIAVLMGVFVYCQTLVDILRQHAMTNNGKAFVFLKDGETEQASLTYPELETQARRIAVFLLMFMQHPVRWLKAIFNSPISVREGPNFACDRCVNKITAEQMEGIDLSTWMAAQGPVIYWVATHRRHHQFSDADGDSHSPHWTEDRLAKSKIAGLLHAQVGSLFGHRISNSAVLSRDLLQDRIVNRLNNRYYYWLLLGLLVPTVIGMLIERSLAGAGWD